MTGKSLLGHVTLDGDAVLFGVRSGELRDFFHQAAQVDFFQVKIARAGEIDQRLHHAIEAADFAVDDVHVAAGIGLLLGQFVAQELQVQHDGVDGILYFVSHAAGEASAGGEAARHLDLVANAADRFGVAHDQQRADLRIFFLHEVERHLDALSSGASNSRCDKGRRRSNASSSATDRGESPVKYFLHSVAEKFRARTAQKSFDRRAHQHHARVAREQHQAILQLGHELIDVVFEGRENFSAVANLAAQVGNFQM